MRERGVVDLPFAIRSMTSLPAQVFALKDRGQIRPGAFADVLIFDPAKVNDAATYQEPHQLAEGMTTSSSTASSCATTTASPRFSPAAS